jgi:pyruvate/2-oxoglutarate dehydrogenase complex dihydrolipoamide acyltransferase (E2) component
MLIEIRVPELGHEAKEAILVAWHKAPGEALAAGEALADVMTDKVNVEIPAPAAGVLKEQRAACDDTVAVGAVIAMLETNP